MTIGKKFNELNAEEYIYFIDNHKKYKDFNTLGLYRSLIENAKLTIEDKVRIRNHAHSFFKKNFDFLQLKDPKTFVEVSILGLEVTKADEEKMWDDVIRNQQIILKDKRIRHRNFGTYSKHNCGHENCIYKGLMIKRHSNLCWTTIRFDSDKTKYQLRLKSEKRKHERKNEQKMINENNDKYRIS